MKARSCRPRATRSWRQYKSRQQCVKCKKVKKLDKFSASVRCMYGYSKTCKECFAKYVYERRRKKLRDQREQSHGLHSAEQKKEGL